ncbi:MAG: hypothetical protein ATN31_01145 [Candidatus Epulonipiscioides saccharophilum]|nr:MAG: hypothetical protein ATN31_01145 [Epulopiscium sp. AS2M-Bin001]
MHTKFGKLGLGLLLLSLGASVQAAEIGYDGDHILNKDAKRGFAPHENYNLVYEDDFNGTAVNESEWTLRTGSRLGGNNYRENTTVSDGLLHVEIGYEDRVGDTATLTGGGVISKKLFGYGYYEAKGQLFGATGGMHSSFWVMGRGGGDNVTVPANNVIIEIDFYEIDSGTPEEINTNVHYYIGNHWTEGGFKDGKTPDYGKIDTSAREFVMGVEWLPNKINWYLDGKLFRTVENPDHYGPQNMWLTGLGSNYFKEEILLDKLPGESNWDYFRFYNVDLLGVNMVVNPSFEYNTQEDFLPEYTRSTKSPVGWYTKGNSKNTATNVILTDESYDGNALLRHGSAMFDYDVTTYLHIPFLPNETYTFSAMVRNSSGGNHTVTISGEGMEISELEIPKTDPGVWEKVTIENIKVEKGEAIISFISDATKSQYLDIDDVSFVQTTGKDPHTSLDLYPTAVAQIPMHFGDIVSGYQHANSGYKEFGTFGNSSLKGYLDKSSRWAATLEGNYATWSPQLTKSGLYEIEFFNVMHENRTDQATIEVHHVDGVEKIALNQKAVSGFVNLGSFNLDENSYVKMYGVPDTGNMSFDSVVFKQDGSDEIKEVLKDGIAVRLDSNIALIDTAKTKINNANPNAVLKVINETAYIPIQFIYEQFGAANASIKDNVMSIFYMDHMIEFTEGSNIMNVATKDISMSDKCFVENGVWYAPAVDVIEAFKIYGYNVNNEYYLFSNKPVPEIKNAANLLEILF